MFVRMNEHLNVGWVIWIFIQKDNVERSIIISIVGEHMVSVESISSKIRNVNALVFLYNNHMI